jgi:hypothetical protein
MRDPASILDAPAFRETLDPGEPVALAVHAGQPVVAGAAEQDVTTGAAGKAVSPLAAA